MGHTDFFDRNNYEFNNNSKNGIYIIHGFSNSTYEVRELAEYLGNNGFYTRADNLPGHGTTADDCNRCKYNDWIKFVEKGVSEMDAKCDNIFIIGISLGSDLAIYLATKFQLSGVVFAATVLKFNNEFKIRILNTIFHSFFPKIDKRKTYNKKFRDTYDYYGYDVYPMTGLNEMRKLTNIVRPILNQVTSPALIIYSKRDVLSLRANFDIVFDNISSNIKETLVLEKSTHNIFTKSSEQQIVFNKILSFFQERLN